MPVPGDRKETMCRACPAKILMIYSVAGRWIPCERLPSRVDGQRMLVFANGVTGRSYANFDGGHESHFAHCPSAKQFRRDKPPSPQGSLSFPEPEEPCHSD